MKEKNNSQQNPWFAPRNLQIRVILPTCWQGRISLLFAWVLGIVGITIATSKPAWLFAYIPSVLTIFTIIYRLKKADPPPSYSDSQADAQLNALRRKHVDIPDMLHPRSSVSLKDAVTPAPHPQDNRKNEPKPTPTIDKADRLRVYQLEYPNQASRLCITDEQNQIVHPSKSDPHFLAKFGGGDILDFKHTRSCLRSNEHVVILRTSNFVSQQIIRPDPSDVAVIRDVSTIPYEQYSSIEANVAMLNEAHVRKTAAITDEAVRKIEAYSQVVEGERIAALQRLENAPSIEDALLSSGLLRRSPNNHKEGIAE